MNVGDIVLCIRGDDVGVLTPPPVKGKSYVVSASTDSCGCGHRIMLKELPEGCGSTNDLGVGVLCGECKKPMLGVVGWARKRFIKISDNKLNDELMNEKEKDLIITI